MRDKNTHLHKIQRMNKNKILICVALTLPYTSGAGVNVFYFARFLKKKGYDVKILTINWDLHHKSFELKDGVPISRIPYFKNRYLRPMLPFITIPCFIYHLLFYKQLIISDPVPGYFSIILLGKLMKRKVILQTNSLNVYDIDTLVHKPGFWGKIKTRIIKKEPASCQKLRPEKRGLSLNARYRKFIFSKLSVYCSVSPAYTESFCRVFDKGNDMLLETSQGFDPCYFYKFDEQKRALLKEKFNIPLNKKVIITIGNVINRKGYSGIFDVLRKIDADFLYLVIGNYTVSDEYYFWQNKQEMETLYQEGSSLLGTKIRFFGRKENVVDYLNVADIFLFNSTCEGGITNALMEAMACGVVPVLRAIEGTEELVACSGVNLIAFNTPDEMKHAVVKLLQDNELRGIMSANAIEFARKNYSFEIVHKILSEKIFQ